MIDDCFDLPSVELTQDEIRSLVRSNERLHLALAKRGDRSGGMLDDPAYQGGSAVLGLGAGEVQAQRIYHNIAENKSRPEIMTVNFDVVPVSAGSNTNAQRPQARICWGSMKGQHTAVVDLVTGARLAVEAIALTVDVALWGFEPLGEQSAAIAGADTPTFQIHASIGYGSSGYGRPNTYTSPLLNGVLVGTDTDQRLPRFARRVTINSTADLYGASPPRIRVGFANFNGGTPRVFSSRDPGEGPVEIPTGAESARFRNAGTSNIALQPIYELSL